MPCPKSLNESTRNEPWVCPQGEKNIGFVDIGFKKPFFRPWACPPGEQNLGFFDLRSKKSFFDPVLTLRGTKISDFSSLGLQIIYLTRNELWVAGVPPRLFFDEYELWVVAGYFDEKRATNTNTSMSHMPDYISTRNP